MLKNFPFLRFNAPRPNICNRYLETFKVWQNFRNKMKCVKRKYLSHVQGMSGWYSSGTQSQSKVRVWWAHRSGETYTDFLCFISVYSFVCLDFVVTLENFALIWRRTDIHLNLTMLNHIHDNFLFIRWPHPDATLTK